MKLLIKFLIVGFAAVAIFIVCSKDKPTEADDDDPQNNEIIQPLPPTHLVGMAYVEDEDIGVEIMWIPSASDNIDGYYLYQKIGDGEFQRAGDSLITTKLKGVGPSGQGDCKYDEIGFVIDTSSNKLHSYYLTAIMDTLESGASNVVSFVPNQIDFDNFNDSLVSDLWHFSELQPTFHWPAVNNTESYLVFLSEENDSLGNHWIYMLNDTLCRYGEDLGNTYLDLLGDSLVNDKDYKMTLLIVNSNYFCFARSLKYIYISHYSKCLRGYYNGEFTVINNWGSGSGSTVHKQNIIWTMTDQRFFCQADSTNIEIELCDFSGYYQLETSILFYDVLMSPGVCYEDFIAEGEFSLTRIVVPDGIDTLLMKQISGDEFDMTLKSIRLVRD